MQPSEIRDKLMSGDMSVDEARAEFEKARAGKPTQSMVPHKTPHPPPLKVQMADRQMLANYRPDLASNLSQLDAVHFYKREILEENVRHGVGLICYGLIGAIDGLLDSTMYGLSEIAEDLSFGGTRILYRFQDGIQRGKG